MKQIFVAATVFLLAAVTACNTNNSQQSAPTSQAEGHHHEDSEIDLVMMMGRLQLFMNKLYFAGVNDNAELRDFYVHEIEETMEEIAEGNVQHEGVDISSNMKTYGLSQLELFEKALESDRGFDEVYSEFINSCNSCHIVSKYPFIKITVPSTPALDNQVFEL